MVRYIAFICGHNSGRSQMAQSAFNHLKRLFSSVDKKYDAISWGTGIKEDGAINPKIIQPMKAIGIDLTDKSTYFPKTIDNSYIQKRLGNVTRAFTMGCMSNVCQFPHGIQVKTEDIVDWDLEDPAEEKTDVTAVRDKIIGSVSELITELSKS